MTTGQTEQAGRAQTAPAQHDVTHERVRRAIGRARAAGGRGLLLPALHAVRDEFGYLPDAAVPLLAAEFNLSRADVHGVISFYRDFRRAPGGRVTVRVCGAEACQAVGARELAAVLEARFGVRIGGATADGAIGLEEVFCLGNCALGPSVSVAGRVVGRATAEGVAAAAERALTDGTATA